MAAARRCPRTSVGQLPPHRPSCDNSPPARLVPCGHSCPAHPAMLPTPTLLLMLMLYVIGRQGGGEGMLLSCCPALALLALAALPSAQGGRRRSPLPPCRPCASPSSGPWRQRRRRDSYPPLWIMLAPDPNPKILFIPFSSPGEIPVENTPPGLLFPQKFYKQKSGRLNGLQVSIPGPPLP